MTGRAGSTTWRPIPTSGCATRPNSTRSTIQGTVNVLDAALAAGAERVLHTSTESILTKARQARPDRRECRDPAGGRGRALLPFEAAGRAICLLAGPSGVAGRRGQSDDAGRSRRSRALAADAADPGFLPRKAAGGDGLHAQSHRRPRRRARPRPGHGARETRTPLPAGLQRT